MSIVNPIRSGAQIVPGAYEKRRTEADAYRFLGSEVGHRVVYRLADAVPFVTPNPSSKFVFTLPFNYIVGMKQLMVFRRKIDAGDTHPWYPLLDRETALTDEDYVEGVIPESEYPYFEELSSTTVLVHNAPESSFLFLVPHTAVAAQTRQKIVIDNQGDNVGVEFLGNGDGIVFRTANGTRVLVRVDDSANITAEKL